HAGRRSGRETQGTVRVMRNQKAGSRRPSGLTAGWVWGGCSRRSLSPRYESLADVEYHDGLAANRDELLLFQILEHPADHLARATDYAPKFLAGDADLHAVRMRHRVWFLAQVEQGAGDTARDVQKR